MFLRHLDLTTALRPSLYDDETLLFVQDGVGLYEGKFKIANYQNGHTYLTSHRVCYVDNEDPRKYSVAVDLKEIDRTEFYAGFIKSSPKVTLFPKLSRHPTSTTRGLGPAYASPQDALVGPGSSTSSPRSATPKSTPAVNATWICPICGMSNAVPPNFDPATANQFTKLPACQACGIPPELVVMVKAAIAGMSNRASNALESTSSPASGSAATNGEHANIPSGSKTSSIRCTRCTFQNHASLRACEMCGAPLQNGSPRVSQLVNGNEGRAESPGPSSVRSSIVGDETIETIKFSFRMGGGSVFFDRIKGAMVQRKWLLQSAPPLPKPRSSPPLGQGDITSSSPAPTPHRVVGIAGLERRGAELRQNNQNVIGTAFEDLEALMTSAKEVIQMAEQFAKRSDTDSDARRILSDSASALGLVTTKDMLGSGSTAEQLYLTELARNLAEFLTDDRHGVLRKEGGIMSLVDLWQVFNRTRNGIELISPRDFEKAASMWASLNLPIRLRRFKSGLLVVQERSRTDEKTIASLLAWLRQSPEQNFESRHPSTVPFGQGATAQEAAERFGWSVGIATEELEMAEETGALCRDQSLDGTRFWENKFGEAF